MQGDLVAEVPPATLKKYICSRGNAPKDQVLAAASKRYPHIDITGNDVADAVVLAAIGARHLGFPIEESPPRANLAALDKINWPEVPRNG
jgi:crossover junction endodeoxyribonuclease RuvC